MSRIATLRYLQVVVVVVGLVSTSTFHPSITASICGAGKKGTTWCSQFSDWTRIDLLVLSPFPRCETPDRNRLFIHPCVFFYIAAESNHGNRKIVAETDVRAEDDVIQGLSTYQNSREKKL